MDELDDLPALAAADEQALERWLQARYTDLYGPDPQRRREAGRLDAYGITAADSFIAGLRDLHDRLPDVDAQQRLRRAIGALLRHAQPGRFPPEAMAELVLLIGFTRAHDQLVVFETVLGSGAWGETTPVLFHHALSVLRGLQAGEEAYKATSALLRCRNFPQTYVFDAYEVLLGFRADQWHVDLEQLAPAMLEEELLLRRAGDRQGADELVERYRMLAEELLEMVSLERLADGLPVLTRRSAHLTLAHPIGRVVAMLATGTAAGGIEADGDLLVLRRAHQSQASRPLQLPAAAELFVGQHLPRPALPAAVLAAPRPQRPATTASREMADAVQAARRMIAQILGNPSRLSAPEAAG